MIFLSYPSSEALFARELHQRLIQEGHAVWVDWEQVGRSPGWRSAVVDSLAACSDMLAVSCDAYWRSEHCQFEMRQAEAQGIPVQTVEPISASTVSLPTFESSTE